MGDLLYDPRTMPAVLVRAHRNLDTAVDRAYGRRKYKTEAERVAYLFEQYQTDVSNLIESTN